MKKVLKSVSNYKHGLLAVGFMAVYFVWFFYLEKTVTKNFHVIHMAIDDYIPFIEVFVVPYFLWFAYVSATVLFLLFTNKTEYYRACAFLFTGMTIFLIISTLWPNGHHLRPYVMPRDNVFTEMIAGLWATDTPTNLWPSIHVYNSIGAHIAVMHSDRLKDKKALRIASLVLCVSIILSTVFIKQHSMFDVLTAFVMAGVMYVAVYRYEWSFLASSLKNRRKSGKSSPQAG